MECAATKTTKTNEKIVTIMNNTDKKKIKLLTDLPVYHYAMLPKMMVPSLSPLDPIQKPFAKENSFYLIHSVCRQQPGYPDKKN